MPALSFLSSTMERASQAVARTSTGGKPTEMGVRYLSKNYAIELSHLHVDRGMHDRQPRAVFASFTVDTLFLGTTSDPWTGPRRSARAGSRSPAAPRSAASAGGRRSGRESWVHPRSVAEVEADRLHHLERRALGEDVGGREYPGVLLDHG